MTHLFVIDVATRATRTLTSGAFTVGSFSWSPDGKSIAFDHRVNPELKNGGSADISIVTVADASIRKLVTQDGPDSQSRVVARRLAHRVPDRDGEPGLLLHATASSRRFPRRGGTPTVLSTAFDEDPQIVAWKPNGLFFAASARTYSYLYRLDPETKAVTKTLGARSDGQLELHRSRSDGGDGRVPRRGRDVDVGGVRRVRRDAESERSSPT